MKQLKVLQRRRVEVLASVLTIISSGSMLFGAVLGFMGPDLSPLKAFIGGLAIGAALVGFYIAARLINLGG